MFRELVCFSAGKFQLAGTSRDLSSRFTSATSKTRFALSRFFHSFLLSVFAAYTLLFFVLYFSYTFTRSHSSPRASIYHCKTARVLPAESRQEQFASLPNAPPINYFHLPLLPLSAARYLYNTDSGAAAESCSLNVTRAERIRSIATNDLPRSR